MAFLEERWSLAVTRGAGGGPRAKRVKAYNDAGALKQRFVWEWPLGKYNLTYGIKREADFHALIDLWHVVMFGPYEGFRIRDWNDYKATRQNTALALVSGTTWQLQRRHAVGAASVVRPIFKPAEDAALVVYDAGGSPIGGGTVDYAAGTWTGTGTPVTWAGQYDVPVTFEEDDPFLGVSIDGNWNNVLASLPPIMLEELLLEPAT